MKRCYIIATCLCLVALGVCLAHAADTKPQTNKAVLELLLGGQHQYKMYYMSTCGRQLEQFKREYPSVSKEFWGQYSTELEKEWIESSVSMVKSRFTPEQYQELAKFASNPTGQALVEKQLLIMKDLQSSTKQQERDRRTRLKSVLEKRGHKKAVSAQNCIYNLRLIDSSKVQYAMRKNLKKGTVVSSDEISQYIKGGFESRICPDGGKYTINNIGEKPVCSVKAHKLD